MNKYSGKDIKRAQWIVGAIRSSDKNIAGDLWPLARVWFELGDMGQPEELDSFLEKNVINKKIEPENLMYGTLELDGKKYKIQFILELLDK